ncbi:MAG: hypothetical protein ABFS34_11545 [Gemmatimonadota bacterium]
MKPRPRKHLSIALLAAPPLFLLVPAGVAGQNPTATSADAIIVAGVEWTGHGNARAGLWHGDDALLIPSGGSARLDDAGFLDGALSFRLATSGAPIVIGLEVRRTGDAEREVFYLRPHRSGTPGAVAFAPRADHATAGSVSGTAFFAAEGWTDVRLELSGERARLFVGPGADPALEVADLLGGAAPGPIILWAWPVTGSPPSPSGDEALAALRDVELSRAEP